VRDDVRIGLVGCGRWGQRILRDLRALACDVTVVARSAASMERARAAGATRIVGAIDELGEIDGAVVATPTSAHAATVDALLDRRVPIFCEKPLCPDPAEAARLVAAAEGRLFVMDKWRYHHGVEALGEIVRSGELGAPVGLVSVREQWGSPHPDVDSLWVHLPHDLAIALEVLGHLPEARHAAGERIGEVAIGLHGTLGVAPWFVVSHSAGAPRSRRSIRLICEAGTATLADGYDDRITVASWLPERDRPPVERAIDAEWPLPRELRAFVAHVGGGPPPRSSGEEHLAIVERLSALRVLAGFSPT
jgi:predicted dehydrogenase